MAFIKIILLVYVLTCTALAQNNYHKPSSSSLSDMDNEIRKYMLANNIPGGLIAIAKDGKLDFVHTYGKSNVELDVDVARDHVFEIGSISKQFVTAAVMMLVEEGKLKLDDSNP